MKIGEAIKIAREDAGMTQQQLADKVGMVAPAICRLEKGGGSPNFRTVNRIMEALGRKIMIV